MVSFATLQIINLFQTIFVFGYTTTLSFVSIPVILLSPSPILAIRQWYLQFNRGRKTATPLSATSLILSTILAYGTTVTGPGIKSTQFILYTLSSILGFVIFPFTLYSIQPLNETLSEKYRAQLQLHYADLPEKDAGMQTARDNEKIANVRFRRTVFGCIGSTDNMTSGRGYTGSVWQFMDQSLGSTQPLCYSHYEC